WERLLEVRAEVSGKLEEARQAKKIGTSLEAQVVLVCGTNPFEYLKSFASDLRYIFIVSEVALEQPASCGADFLEIRVEPASGNKCERCWTYSPEVGTHRRYATVCSRC